MAAFYDERYFVASDRGGYDDYLRDEALHRLNARDRLKRLRQAGATSGRLLDIGCAAGFFLDEARQAGWEVMGVDCSPWARQQGQERLGLTIHASVADAVRSDLRPFTAVTWFQVLEHVADPGAALREARAALAPEGVIVIETWDRESFVARVAGRHWQQVTPPSVLHLFSRRSALRLAGDCGYAGAAVRCNGKRVSAGFVGQLLRQKYPRLLAPVGWATSLPGVRDISAVYALGDLVTLTARKGTAAPE
jgi:SAM-dependent methyltransferase